MVDDQGNTALHHAASSGNVKCIAALLDADSLGEALNNEDATPLHYAAYRGHKDALSMLLQKSAHAIDMCDSSGKTPLMLAAFRGRTQVVSALLASSAQVNIQDKDGWTALMYAAFTGRIAICRELLEYGAGHNITNYKSGKCAADLAHDAGYYEVVDILQNKEINSLRTPSLPEGMYIPSFKPLARPKLPNSEAVLRPPIERALSPSEQSHQAHYAPPQPLKPPTIPPSPLMHEALSRHSVSGQNPSLLLPTTGLNIVFSATKPYGDRSSADRTPSNKKPGSKRPPRNPALPTILEETPKEESNNPARQNLYRSGAQKRQPEIAAPPTQSASERISRNVAAKITRFKAVGAQKVVSEPQNLPSEQHNQRQPSNKLKPATTAVEGHPAEQPHAKGQKLGRRRQEIRHYASTGPEPASVAAANRLERKSAQQQVRDHNSGPLHTPIFIAQNTQNRNTPPGSGWAQQRHQNSSHRTTGTSKPASIQERIKDNVSRASLRYLDSRTSQALKHESRLTPIVTNDCSSNAKLVSPGASRRPNSNCAESKRKVPMLSGPYKRYHDSAWIYPYWRAFSRIVTLWMPEFVLDKILRKRTPDKRQAWREKIALCFIILVITALTALISFGLSFLLCHPVEPISLRALSEKHGVNATTQKLTAIRGRIYDVSDTSDAEILKLPDSSFGSDSSGLFAPFPEESRQCKHWPKYQSPLNCYSIFGEHPQCTASKAAWKTLLRLRTNKWVVYQWNDVLHKNNLEKLFVYNEVVYSLKPYLSSTSNTNDNSTAVVDEYFGPNITNVLRSIVGTDATIAVSRSKELQELVPCWNSQLRLGRIDGSTIGCVITSGITISVTVILNIMILIKLACAVLFDWAFSLQLTKITKHFKHGSAKRIPHVLITITCYNENEDTLITTLDSVALNNYASSRKVLFIIADGDVEATGDSRTTPDILRNIISSNAAPSSKNPDISTPLPYIAIGEGPREFNAAEVIPGSYTSGNGITVPCILIIKVGTKRERDNSIPKAGNRGKRDSQLIILQWLHNVLMNDHLTPLEFELCRAATQLAQINPDQFEYLLMIDADTSVDIECIPRLVAAMERDPGIMGLCGETRIANKRESWVTRIQVYEYYISHHLSKAFESLWGGVTCLPGCCSMYRIFSRKSQSGSLVPLLVAPEVIEAYSSNDTHTLHQKNLLLLGEDRYLTTVLLRAFPKRKLIYVPRAICRTTVPNKFSTLVSQRRRWINSTIHNLLELVLVRDLCGTFCCSMQFLVLMDLLGNVVLPSSVIFFYYLIVAECMGYPVSLPLLLMALTFVLQGAMILVTTQRISYIYWMVIYILAIPVWNLIMPLYAFWRFDDFSWGRTRTMAPEDAKAEFITDDERQALEPIPLKRWKDWMRDNWGSASQSNITHGDAATAQLEARASAVATVKPSRIHRRT
ncbi:ATP-dependent RNA helicase [Coemansia sp. RSA 1358]|uniref:chitin synthase n=1 Tax=Coemansia umbellata TaxID=1424467 RepID=A0ABQ8PT42_9FUNG|nr:ATP-dependent RNA helicase [Coemansia umbellata]KAJ2624059.1 ATP-dependent RNA helicase [Coemansia sp. RSA 1358]